MNDPIGSADHGHGYYMTPSDAQIAVWEAIRRKVSKVYPNLYVSGYPSDEVKKQIKSLKIDAVVSLTHAEPGDLGILTSRFPFTDRADGIEEQVVKDATAHTVMLWKHGHKVLVHCAYGLNRSTLVAACAIHEITSLPGPEIVEIIQAQRPGALHNPMFLEMVASLGQGV
jgi:protein-tyrosine phosphatase